MTSAIAIVGMACRYPDADSPEALWENVLAQRRAFRRLPAERLNLRDYGSDDVEALDRTYLTQAAVLEGYTFDRVRYRVSGNTFRSVDMAHWLALDVATEALADAGFAEGEGLPKETTGVIVGNSLTGEFSRANLMRLRWPYVQRVLDTALAEEGWSVTQRSVFLEKLEADYKAPFPTVGTETLAGGLSNTIAGRICNYFDLNGGGFTVDGACASSLLAVTQACIALASGDVEVALAGGVDLSLDPFELIGFARVGALAIHQMRIYDERSAGFWPGEGCGFVVLMPYEKAVQQGRRVYAVLRGWGISSDGSGGITRPSVEGQIRAVRRAYQKAGFGPETVSLFEGHGTGTSVGDAVELQVLSQVRREADAAEPPAAIGSVKANIGHTKAAAGLAGLLKATLALHHQMLPPTTGCERPHAELTSDPPMLRVLKEGVSWPQDAPLRAGVSAMGFGGINTHVVLEGTAPSRAATRSAHVQRLLRSPQDAELFLLGAADRQGMRQQIEHLLTLAPQLSLAELADLAVTLASHLTIRTVRAAIVASTAAELTERLKTLAAWLDNTTTTRLEAGVCLGINSNAPRIGFLFPGQGSPTASHGGALVQRFAAAQAVYAAAALPTTSEEVATDIAQPAIVTASLAALEVLHHCGVTADTAVGHSLGELTALHWGGVFDRSGVLRLATIRGQAMANLGSPTGAMAGLSADEETTRALIGETPVVIAGLNGLHQTVISGEEAAVDAVVARAQHRQVDARMLRVSHAFHSDLVAAAAEPLADYLSDIELAPLQGRVLSTITGTPLSSADDLKALLVRQVTAPVRFTEAVTGATPSVDFWIEVGPGRVLSTLASTFIEAPAVATDVGGASLRGLLQAIGAAFAAGAPVDARTLFEDRFTRPFSLDWQPRFLANPCEQAPTSDPDLQVAKGMLHHNSTRNGKAAPPAVKASSTLDLVRQLVATRAELPLDAVRGTDHLLSDLHLNSITVSELMVEATRHLKLAPSATPTNYADATLADVAAALDERVQLEEPAPDRLSTSSLIGIEEWIRPFTVVHIEQPRPPVQEKDSAGTWQVITPPDYPLQQALNEAFQSNVGGRGVVVALPPGCTETHLSCLLAGARAVMAETGPCRFVLVQHGAGVAAFARTVHLELPQVSTCIVDVPLDHPDTVAWVVAEVQAATGFTEVVYDAEGVRRVPRLRLLPTVEAPGDLPLGPEDVLLVTGGGKGITAACVFDLAQATGVRLVLVGRSLVSEDAEVASTLARMHEANLDARYLALDITDAEVVRTALNEIVREVGPITAVIHGAARNIPQRLGTMDEVALLETLAPKVDGLRHMLEVVDPEQLHLLVAFGSIIGRMGLPGEAHYALANEQLKHLVDDWQKEHPACQCLTIEWSIWSEVGMGARLGSIDALRQRGITPISPEQGLAILRDVLVRPLPDTTIVVAGRFGELPTLQFEERPLPLWRFLETPRRHVPGVELIVEAPLSVDTDPYLNDHRLQGERLLPAVVGLEAMAQTAMALMDTAETPVFEGVSFRRPIVVPGGAGLVIRIAALVQAPGQVEVVIRSEHTAFQVDYFRCICRFGLPEAKSSLTVASVQEKPLLPLGPDDLYGSILFHTGRFRRLRGYRALQAKGCIAEIEAGDTAPWFSAYLPADLVLGDPGRRDAAIHALQACIPHGTLIPIGVERFVPETGFAQAPRFVHARERSREGDTFVYDMAVADAEGQVLETWYGLQLQRVGPVRGQARWAIPLLRPYLERRVEELTGTTVHVVAVQDEAVDRRSRSTQAMQAVLGPRAKLRRNGHGKPETDNGAVSATHAGRLTLAVAGDGTVACDIETVMTRPEDLWGDLLGPSPLRLAQWVAAEASEPFDVAATRIWSALECLKKAGPHTMKPLTSKAAFPDGWVVLTAGTLVIATVQTQVQHLDSTLVIAVLVEQAEANVSAQPVASLDQTSPAQTLVSSMTL